VEWRSKIERVCLRSSSVHNAPPGRSQSLIRRSGFSAPFRAFRTTAKKGLNLAQGARFDVVFGFKTGTERMVQGF